VAESDHQRPLCVLCNARGRCWTFIFSGIGVLLLAAKDVESSQDALIDLFDRIENFFKRLETYTTVPLTDTMTDIIVKIMIEVLNIFAIATKEMKQSRASVLVLLAVHNYWLISIQKNMSRSLWDGMTSRTL